MAASSARANPAACACSVQRSDADLVADGGVGDYPLYIAFSDGRMAPCQPTRQSMVGVTSAIAAANLAYS